MGKQWKKDGKAQASAKKGAIFTKMAREIQVAARLGSPDPESNSRLKIAIAMAQKHSVPKDTIERAIKKGSGQLGADALIEELTYEGYGPHGVGVIVECQSDNKTRTVSEIRMAFKKNGGTLGESGAVSWMFTRVAMIEATHASCEDSEAEAIEVGASDLEVDGQTVTFYALPDELDQVRTQLVSRGWEISTSELSYRAKDITPLSDTQKEEVVTLLNALEDNDDTHRVHATIS